MISSGEHRYTENYLNIECNQKRWLWSLCNLLLHWMVNSYILIKVVIHCYLYLAWLLSVATVITATALLKMKRTSSKTEEWTAKHRRSGLTTSTSGHKHSLTISVWKTGLDVTASPQNSKFHRGTAGLLFNEVSLFVLSFYLSSKHFTVTLSLLRVSYNQDTLALAHHYCLLRMLVIILPLI